MEKLKGRRFKVTYLTKGDKEKGIKVGDEGVILENSNTPFVRMDRYSISLSNISGRCEKGHGAVMGLDQIELLPEEWTPKFGEKVLAWNKDSEKAEVYVFLFVKKDSRRPYNVVAFGDEELFYSDKFAYQVQQFKEVMRFKETITKAEAEAQLGKKIID